MKNKYFILIFLMAAQISLAYGQWSTDPENPGIVCDAGGLQINPQAFADDDGGVYVFWLDNRLNAPYAHEVYGQHYDANGYALWEEDGRLILNHSTKINWFNASRIYNGEIIIGWLTSEVIGTDSLWVQRLDENGSKIWADDLPVANAGMLPDYILGMYGYYIIHDNSGYCISIGTVYFGGSSGNRISRFTSDGILTGRYNGEPEGTQYNFGSSGLQSAFDASDNVYIYYSTGNGSGAELMCLKVNTAGDTLWGPVAVLEGTQGLAYQFSGISDDEGITFVWQGYGDGGDGTNLYARRLNADGSRAWNETTMPVCVADGTQGNFFWKRSGDNYYITWADARPGTDPGFYDIFARKFDANGAVYWTENGVPVASLNTYLPYPEFDFSDDNGMIICHQSTAAGFVAQKVNDDGTIAWDEDGNMICTSINAPFYAEHVEVRSGGKVISAWAKANPSGGSDNIFITRVDDAGTVGIKELKENQIHIYPNPATDEITLVLPGTMDNAELNLYDFSGKELRNFLLTSIPGNSLRISTNGLSSGTYLLRIKTDHENISHKLIVK
ncbi:MAG: T9SS type A sorting domain-containing protein [Bacteroidales bacterium]|nr:T9SS type A sorting domain-containing protein [Bacteroidales bacterium]